MNSTDCKEFPYAGKVLDGFVMLAVTLLLIPAVVFLLFAVLPDYLLWLAITAASVGFIAVMVMLNGFFVQQPNQSRVMIFFGKYRGTFRGTGYFWVNPFMSRKKISLRIRNMDIPPIKVNDKVGNPVMIGMVLVWRVRDTYRAVFDVDSADTGRFSVSPEGKINL